MSDTSDATVVVAAAAPPAHPEVLAFLEKNKLSESIVRDGQHIIQRPWGDDSFELKATPELIPHLPHMYLPPRFSAIWHLDSGAVEFTFGYLNDSSSLWKRDFKVQYKGKEYRCYYGATSQRVLAIAKAMARVGPSRTVYRNLVFLQSPTLPQGGQARPVSFWIAPVPADNDDDLVLFSRHLNFFMAYFDDRSPEIEIHATAEEFPAVQRRLPGSFPETITMRELDSLCLDLATASRDEDPRLAFIYLFQILEHAAFYFVQEDTKNHLKRVLLSPDLFDSIDLKVSTMLDLLSSMRSSDEDRIRKVVEERVEPSHVWDVIQKDVAYFSTRHAFDGGFVLEPLISADTTYDAFKAMWMPKVPNLLITLRNALVHHREVRSSSSIGPGDRNEALIAPWVQVVQLMAYEVMIYQAI